VIFIETPLKGAFIIELQRLEDERGFFARAFCRNEFEAQGLKLQQLAQASISLTRKKGTIRGLHWLAAPHEESKVIRCVRGAIFNAIIDWRAESPTRGRVLTFELSAANGRALYLPPLFANGFQTLEDDTETFYMSSQFYNPDAVRGIRWDDPSLKIKWPFANPLLSERDRSFPFIKL
jgi:dTDP-4-dehydrorhamnose 3,5-epimerase